MEWINGDCFRYRVYNDDGIALADIDFDKRLIEKDTNFPTELTSNEITKMLRDLVDFKRHVDSS
jgi:hypothetical protein